MGVGVGNKDSPHALLLHSRKLYSLQSSDSRPHLPALSCLTQAEGSVRRGSGWPRRIVGRPHQPCSQGRVTEPDIPNGFPRPDTWVLPGRGTLGRIGMGPSAAVTHPVISWTFIHFLLNYVLFKMVFCGFLPGSFQITPSWCPR